MKKIKRLICFATLLLSGCAVEELDNPQNIVGDFPTFYASFGDAAGEKTKTYVDERISLRWTMDDRLSIFVGNTFNHEYKFDGETGANNGSFSSISNPEFIAAEPLEANYAVYPYNASNEMDTDGSMSVILPSVQKYAQNSFGLGANTMVAATENKEDNFLQFKNLCGYIVVKLYGEGTVMSVKLEGNNGEKISGKADVRAAYGVMPSVTMSEEAGTSITIDCEYGVDLGTTAESATEFWFCVPPVTFSKGFTVTAINDEGWQMVKSTSSSKEVVRNTKNALTSIYAVFDDDSQIVAKEREALMALYHSTDGDHWTKNDNWGSDKPLSEWYGVYLSNGRIDAIMLERNNLNGPIPDEIANLDKLYNLVITNSHLSGEIPACIGKLKNLAFLDLSFNDLSGEIPANICNMKLYTLDLTSNKLSGTIPSSIGNLSNLTILRLSVNQLEGAIPSSIGNLYNLQILFLDGNKFTSLPSLENLSNLRSLDVGNNKLSGTFPPELAKLTNLESIGLYRNNFCGPIPESYRNWNVWKGMWFRGFINWNGIMEREVMAYKIQAPDFHVVDLNGNHIDNTVFQNYKYTALWHCPDESSEYWLPIMKELYQNYHELGFNIIEWNDENLETAELLASQCEWPVLYSQEFSDHPNNISGLPNYTSYPGGFTQELTIVDSTGTVVHCSHFNDGDAYCWAPNMSGSVEFVKNLFNPVIPDYYVSSDYSADGTVHTVQTASTGNGVNVVLMGDAFSDRQITDGTYNNVMQKAVTALFSEEPYKSYKDCFNVYIIDAVSETEGYEHKGQVFGTGHGDDTYVYGNDTKVFAYAMKALTAEQMDDALIIVMMNEDAYAGTCFMYYPDSGDYGRGSAIAYFPTNSDIDTFNGIVSHEAGGHGFAKLGDEYAYEEMGMVTDQALTDTKQQEPYGWYKNVDFTSDPVQVKWSKFLSDERYANEGLGCFEGGLTYWSGVWRPTDYSIMRYNTGGFNAPSREAIWYRIHKLAYGEEWQYNYEDFVTYDAINRTPAAQAASRAKVKAATAARKGKPFQPLHEPVVIKRSWKEAVNNPGKDGR